MREVSEDPPFAVHHAFLSADACRELSDFMLELHAAGELCRNVFQAETFVANVSRPEERGRPDDPRWQRASALRTEMFERLGADPGAADESIGDFLSLMMPGGVVMRHRDDWQLKDREHRCHVRFNLFLRKDKGSGDPLIEPDDSPDGSRALRLPLGTGDLLIFSPSTSMHGTTRVEGGPRIMASLSQVLSNAAFRELIGRR